MPGSRATARPINGSTASNSTPTSNLAAISASRPWRFLPSAPAPALLTAEVDHSIIKEGIMANSLLSSLFGRIKSIVPGLTGQAQGGAGQKAQGNAGQHAQTAAAPQNEGGEPDVSAEVDSIMRVNPPTGRWIAYAFVFLAA